jgi:hypothetical protein
METLDDHLAEVGWQPPEDTLARLAPRNEWIRRRFFDDASGAAPSPTDVYLLRERASGEATIERAQRTLERLGFDVLVTHVLDPAAVQRAAEGIRGGNWGRGPFATSAGDPAVMLVAMDSDPRRPSPEVLQSHAALSNANVLTAKLAIRDDFLGRVPADEECNPVHSADSDRDAWHYITLAAPERVDEIRAMVDDWIRHAPARSTAPVPREPDLPPSTPAGQGASVRRVVRRAKRSLRSIHSAVLERVARRRLTSLPGSD